MEKFVVTLIFVLLDSISFSSSTGIVKPKVLATVYSLPKEPLSDFEASSLIFMIEEKKLARDVYMTLYKIWGQRHSETLRCLKSHICRWFRPFLKSTT